jgi:hypothetical protein
MASMPGAFGLNQPYGMPSRVRRALGIAMPPQKALSPMQGTVGPGKGTSTLTEPPAKGMGKVSQIDPAVINRQKNLFGGVPPLNPRTRIPQEPKQPMSVRYASAYPTEEQALAALRGDDLNPVVQFVSKEAQAERLLETVDLLDVIEGKGGFEEKTAALVRLVEVKREAQFARFLRNGG